MDDFTQSWTFPLDSIDFVHLRYMIGSVKDWPALFREAYKCIKPSGYIESFDPRGIYESDDGTVKQGSAMEQWGEFLDAGGKAMGQSFRVVDEDVQRLGLEEAGFVNIEYRDIKVPTGTWPKDPDLKQAGLCAYYAVSSDVEGHMVYMAELLGWSMEEVYVYAAHIRRELRDPNIHGYYIVRVAWAMKPEA
ncbi:methyltransferase domain-containing protein [Candidatus Bathyarchaeota archaeon]|nr:methyltransferase domain-containing protein [Candidatus Bathyarchaeota archaeon]